MIHIKGRVLQLIQQGPKWDFEIAASIIKEYRLKDTAYWRGNIRVTIADLLAGALVKSIEEVIDSQRRYFNGEKMVFKLSLTPFGLDRMSVSGLLLGE